MWKLIFTILVCATCYLQSGSAIGKGVRSHAWPSQKDAEQTRVIAMYYSVGTDAFFNSIDEMKKQSDYVMEIRCWLGCVRYVKRIATYFEGARKMSTCPRVEDKYLLIELLGDKSSSNITYLKGGHISIFDGKCFYSEKSIDDFFPSPNAFEEMLDK
ncbi:hypothetical protein [Rhodanobacter lindaniclasticus]|uniref:hypothetical protein n=1 Tax=Rhodanobacter lindaniclasticus TaxID=75310 RepID=UPI0010A04F92|nr:hypothetical protein [Rhodanobacter lindaniclasticus]